SHARVRPLLRLRDSASKSLLVGLLSLFLRHLVEADPERYGDFGAALMENIDDPSPELEALPDLLDYHRPELEALLELDPAEEEADPGRAEPGPTAAPQPVQDDLALAPTPYSEYEQAINLFNGTLSAEPDLVTDFVRRAEAHRSKGDYRQALADYDAALEQ